MNRAEAAPPRTVGAMPQTEPQTEPPVSGTPEDSAVPVSDDCPGGDFPGGAAAPPSDSILNGFPGPLLMFSPSADLQSAQPEDCPLALLLRAGGGAEAQALVAVCASSRMANQGTVQVESGDGIYTYDLTVLPLPDGRVAMLAREVTLHHNLRAALVESRQRYKDFVEISSDFAWETGIDGTFVFVSPRGALGHPAADLIGRDPVDLVMERDAQMGLPFSTHVPIDHGEVWVRRADGVPVCVTVAARPIFDRSGRWIGTRGVCRDVTTERERDLQLARARNRERIVNHIVRTFRDEVDPNNMLNVAAETLARGMGASDCHIFRRPSDTLEESHPSELPAGLIPGARYGALAYLSSLPVLDALDHGEELVEMDVEGRQVLAVASRHHHRVNGAVVLYRVAERGNWGVDDRFLLSDLADQIGIANEQIAAHESIVRLSRTDSLTGLFNRRAFFEELERRHKRLQRTGASAALLYVDLDNFKMVNDVHGHAAGDAVLQLVRDMLLGNTRPTDLVARLGGDEFAVWLEGGTLDVAEDKARLLLSMAERLLRPRSGNLDHPLGLSMGIAVHDPSHPESLHDLMARADQAMYSVKKTGKLGVAVADHPVRSVPS